MRSPDSEPVTDSAAPRKRRDATAGNVILPAMYMRFFGLKQQPFSLAPDPRYLYMSKRHREALAHLLYGVGGGGGFVLLSGEIGAGKTTVCRCFLEQIPKRCNVAYIFNPKLTVMELLKTVCDEFHIPPPPAEAPPPTVKTYVDALNEFLLQTHAVGQNNVLIIDEAQMLAPEVLEQLRLLTNLETNERKLLQIVLIGQPELRTMLEQPELEQLAQRVIARFHLNALSAKETEHYIRHRLSVAGMTRAIPFDASALQRIHELTRGVPRRINLLCDRVMLGAYAHSRHQIDVPMIEKAAREVFGRPAPAAPGRARLRSRAGALAAAGAALAALVAVALYVGWRQAAAPPALAAAASPASPGASTTRAPPSPSSAAVAVPSAASRPSAGAASTAATSSSVPPAAAAMAAAPVRAAPGTASTGLLDTTALRAQLKTFGVEERDAWRDLLPMWGVDPGEGDPCIAATRRQVRCSKFVATLPMLRSLGRPGLVWLRDDAGRSTTALLLGLSDTTATLRAGDETLAVRTAALAKVWRGEFATAWRLPPGYVAAVADGASGPIVDRLATQMASFAGEPPPPPGQTMNAGLAAKIGKFQAAHGLPADGRAGPTTFMQLNRAIGVDEPRLTDTAH
jgi:general secretion pathway protein A